MRVLLDGHPPACATYDATANSFHYVLKSPKSLTPGKHTVTIQVRFPGGTSSTDVPLVIRPETAGPGRARGLDRRVGPPQLAHSAAGAGMMRPAPAGMT